VIEGLRGKPMGFRCTLRKGGGQAPTGWFDEMVALATEPETEPSPSPDVADLAGQLEYAANALRPLAALRSVRVLLDSGRGPWQVRGQATRLRQLLDMLMQSTLSATPCQGDLRVRASVEDGEAVLDVTPSAERPGAPSVRVRFPLIA
jgi:signal transduction histidine kinase